MKNTTATGQEENVDTSATISGSVTCQPVVNATTFIVLTEEMEDECHFIKSDIF